MSDIPASPIELSPAAGASPQPSESKVEGLLHVATERHVELNALIARAAPGAKSDPLADADFVHDVRVASRRLSEVARLLESLLDKPSAKAVSASLRSLRRSM